MRRERTLESGREKEEREILINPLHRESGQETRGEGGSQGAA